MEKTKVLAFCLKEIPSATVGVVSTLNILKKKGYIDFCFKETLAVTEQEVAWADIVVCIRGCENIEREIMKEGQRLGKFLIYFMDDDLLNIPKNSASALYFDLPHIRDNILGIIKLSNCLWTTNINLLKKYESYVESAVTINAPSLLLENTASFPTKEKDDKITIGFAGSIDHGSYLNDFLKQIVFDVLELYPHNVYFEFFGAKPDFIELSDRILHIPYANNYDEYKKMMKSRSWDVGLAPLPSTEFHSCKYFNKYLEYGAIGVPGIYSNVEPYVFVVEEGKTGLLVDNNYDDWLKAIETLINNKELNRKIKEQSYKQLQEAFTSEKIAEEVLSKIPRIGSYKAPYCSSKEVKLTRETNNMYLFKIKRIFKNHGFGAFYVIIKKIIMKLK